MHSPLCQLLWCAVTYTTFLQEPTLYIASILLNRAPQSSPSKRQSPRIIALMWGGMMPRWASAKPYGQMLVAAVTSGSGHAADFGCLMVNDVPTVSPGMDSSWITVSFLLQHATA